MKIKPKKNYVLLGADIALNSSHVYDATPATNQPDWEKRGLVFVGPSPGVLLNKKEYEVISK